METASAKGLRLLGHHDLGGSGDGMQVLREGDALYVGHFGTSGTGTSIPDVAVARPVARRRPGGPRTRAGARRADGPLAVGCAVSQRREQSRGGAVLPP